MRYLIDTHIYIWYDYAPSDHLIISHALCNGILLISDDEKFPFYRGQGLELAHPHEVWYRHLGELLREERLTPADPINTGTLADSRQGFLFFRVLVMFFATMQLSCKGK